MSTLPPDPSRDTPATVGDRGAARRVRPVGKVHLAAAETTLGQAVSPGSPASPRPPGGAVNPFKGRGSPDNPSGRFEPLRRIGRGADGRPMGLPPKTPGAHPAPRVRPPGDAARTPAPGTDSADEFASPPHEDSALWDDGWGAAGTGEDGPDLPAIETTIIKETARTIISRNSSPDVGFDQSINPYRGCEHGCVYCYARPSHSYMGLSPGLDFETRLFAKPQAALLLERELRRPGYRCAPIAMGTNTDPYQPIERRLRITRDIIEVLARFRHPLAIVTKSALIMRDRDLLAEMASRNLVRVMISVTTLDRHLARRLEPRAATPERRLEAMAALNAAGVPCGVMTAPMIPALNDHEMEAILEGAAASGARQAGYTLLRLPYEVKDLFSAWLERHTPERAAHVLARVRETRGGALNDAQYGRRMRGSGDYAAVLAQRFSVACARLGLNREKRPLDCQWFTPPAKEKDGAQLSLFPAP